MQVLGVPPGAAVAVFAKMFHYQANVFNMADARFRVPKPKALGMIAHQGRRALAQFRRSGCGRRQLAQFIVLGSHETNVRTIPAQGKESLPTLIWNYIRLCLRRGRGRRLFHLQLNVQVAELFGLDGAGRVGHQARAFRGFRERDDVRK